MKYQSLRETVKTGDLIAFSHYKWASWYDLQVQAVRIFTQSEYSHVALAVVWANRVWIVESVVPLIRLVPLSNFVDEGFYHVALPEMTEQELNFALTNVGKGNYSKLQGVLAQLSKLKVGEDSKWQCAEFAIACRRLSDVDLGNKATPSAVVAAALNEGQMCYVKG